MAPADYGVQVADTTFELIRDSAATVKALAAQQPPQPSCKVGCWVPEAQQGTFSAANRCAAPSPASAALDGNGRRCGALLQSCAWSVGADAGVGACAGVSTSPRCASRQQRRSSMQARCPWTRAAKQSRSTPAWPPAAGPAWAPLWRGARPTHDVSLYGKG